MSRPTRKFDKFKAFFRYQRPEPSSNIPATSPPATTQKGFMKSKNFEKDIAVLSTSYIIDQNPDLKSLICMIISIHDNDEEDQLSDILETCAQFSMQLASATEAHRTEITEPITAFIKIVEKIKMVQGDGDNESSQTLMSMVNDGIGEIKCSHPFMRDYDTGSSEGRSDVLGVVIGGGIAFLQVIGEASAFAPVPGIKPLIGGVVSLLQAVSKTRSNYSDMKDIASTAGEFAISCAVICSDRTTEPSTQLTRSLNKFTKELKRIAKECDELSKLNPFWRYLQRNSQNDDLKAIKERLKKAIEVFQNESQVNIQLDIKDISTKLDYTTLHSLPSHPYYKPTEYLHASRDDAIQHISGWIDEPNEFVLWVHGAAGLGKSTLSQQLVNLLKSDDRLVGGVFLTNLTTEQPQKVIQMISKQLGEMHPLSNVKIAEAARKINGPHGALTDYFTSYIIDPVRTLNYSYQLVIVVDGLDEWTNREPFLAELEHIPQPSTVKFILTSRPNYSIERVLNKIPVRRYPLPPVSQETVECYFNYHFGSEKINWRGRRPDQGTISQLATLAQGFLIWAATVRSLMSYESDDRYPHVILDQIISSEEKVGTRSGELLERLYKNAIESVFPESDMRQKLRYFLGGMTVLQEELPIRDFSRLINISERPAEEIQRRLVAFQTRENRTGNILPAIQQFHFSFLEFVQPISVEDDKLHNAISSFDSHSLLAIQCLKIVFTDLLLLHRGQSCVYSELLIAERYAVKFWPLHVSNGTPRSLAALSEANNSLYTTILGISDPAMQRWGTLFLPVVATRFQDGYGPLHVPSCELPYELAMVIGKDDMSTLSYRIHCLEVAVRLQPIDVETWQELGESYHMLYQYGRYNQSLEEEINVFRQVLELVSQNTTETGSLDDNIEEFSLQPGPHFDRFAPLDNLAYSLQTRFEQQGTSIDLDEAISLYREALSHRPAPHPDHSMSLNNLAATLQLRFEQQGTSSDLDESISLHREALDLFPASHPNHSLSLNNLAISLQTRFKQQGASNDLDEAISLHQEALALLPATHPDRSLLLSNLANSLQSRFEQQGISNDLHEAISLLREALALQPPSHPDCSISFNNLAYSPQTRSKQQVTSSNLDEAISLHQEAPALRPASHPNYSILLHNLANSLATRFKQQGASNDLHESIYLLREALALRPAPHPLRPSSLNILANSLETRFKQQGASNDLDEAISLLREAIALLPAPHPDRSMSLNNLAAYLQTRFEQQGTSSELDEAISLHREALALQPAPHPYCYMSLNNLALCLQIRFDQQGTSNDLDETIFLLREAIALLPAPHPNRSVSLDYLAKSLQTRFEQQGTSSELDEAISLLRESLALRPAAHPDRLVSLSYLANSLNTRFEHSGTSKDLDEAISLLREAVRLRPPHHPWYSSR